MCVLFGVSSDHNIKLNDYLTAIRSHSQHSDGWGFATLRGKRMELIKEPARVADSLLFEALLQSEIKSRCALAHIRCATAGNIEYDNCHPFAEVTSRGRRLILVHNGTIFDYDPLSPYLYSQAGDTDSERILLYLTDVLDDEESCSPDLLSSEERFQLFDREITAMSRGNKLNLILYDGENMYVHTNYRDSLYFLKRDSSMLFATSPLSDEPWQPFPFLKLMAFRDGQLVAEGCGESEEYIETEEDLKTIYQNYSGL